MDTDKDTESTGVHDADSDDDESTGVQGDDETTGVDTEIDAEST